jgi:hypothetical protein
VRPSGPGKGQLTAQGSPRAIFERAIERGNVALAETTLRAEIPRPTLVDLLELTALIALKEPQRHARVSARWLQRWLEAHAFATIYDAAFAVAALQALGGRHHQHALTALRALAEEVSGSGRSLAAARRSPGRSRV